MLPLRICTTSKTDILKSSMLNHRGRKQLILKNICICKMFCGMLYSALCNGSVDLVVLTKTLLRLCVHNMHNYTVYVQWSIIYVYKCMYIYATALECAAPTVFMAWQRAWFFKVREWSMRADANLRIIKASAWETRKMHKRATSTRILKKNTIRNI